MAPGYVELHAKSFYSFGVGASHPHELLAQAQEHGYPALALTDTNLCGALEFAQLANSLGLRPITGGEVTLTDGSRLTLLAGTRAGYANLARLFTLANAADRQAPQLDPAHLPNHAAGVILLTGGRDGRLARLALAERYGAARALLRQYVDWYGSGAVCVELQQNFLHGDRDRNRKLVSIARAVGVPVVATNDVHYHCPERSRLQDALVAAKHNTTIDRALPQLRPNQHFPPEVPGPTGAALRRLPGGRDQHAPGGGAVRLRPQHRPGLHAAGARRAGGLYGRALPAATLPPGGRAALRRHRAAARGGAPARRTRPH